MKDDDQWRLTKNFDGMCWIKADLMKAKILWWLGWFLRDDVWKADLIIAEVDFGIMIEFLKDWAIDGWFWKAKLLMDWCLKDWIVMIWVVVKSVESVSLKSETLNLTLNELKAMTRFIEKIHIFFI